MLLQATLSPICLLSSYPGPCLSSCAAIFPPNCKDFNLLFGLTYTPQVCRQHDSSLHDLDHSRRANCAQFPRKSRDHAPPCRHSLHCFKPCTSCTRWSVHLLLQPGIKPPSPPLPSPPHTPSSKISHLHHPTRHLCSPSTSPPPPTPSSQNVSSERSGTAAASCSPQSGSLSCSSA